MGLSRGLVFGGNGAPDFDWWEPMSELVGIRIKEGFVFNIPVKPRGTSSGGFADNVTALDARWRSAGLNGTEFFLEMYEEDPLDFQDFFPEDTIFHGGVWIPRLSSAGDWQLLVDGTHAADIVYSHHIFHSGFTQNQRLIGSDIGFSSNEFRIWAAKIVWPRLKLWGSYGMRFHDVPNQGRPTETRFIVQSGAVVNLDRHWRASLAGGLQQTRNFDFVPDQDRTSFLAEVDLYYLW